MEDPGSSIGNADSRLESPVPGAAPEGLNWGAFLLPFFWSIAHKAWFWMVVILLTGVGPLVALVCEPGIGSGIPKLLTGVGSLVASVVLLMTGNKVAWTNRKFASLDEFRKVQKAWTKWGLIVLGVSYVMRVLWAVIIFPTLVIRDERQMVTKSMQQMQQDMQKLAEQDVQKMQQQMQRDMQKMPPEQRQHMQNMLQQMQKMQSAPGAAK